MGWLGDSVKSLLFVCLGNICRSPLAEGIAREYAKKHNIDLVVDSAGTSRNHEGEKPCDRSITVARKNGIDITHQRARQINSSDFSKFDMVIALDSSNYANLSKMGCKNLYKLGDFGANGADVPDPYYYSGYDGFDEVFSMIEGCVKNLIETI